MGYVVTNIWWRLKTQNDFLCDWIPFLSTYVSIILELEAPLNIMARCVDCLGPDGIIQVHCPSCLGDHAWYGSCAIKVHLRLPFHWLQWWNGHFYEAIPLQELGFTWNLGHGGDACPLHGDKAGDQFTVVDSTGIFVHTVRWCRCNGAGDKDKDLQLLRCRLFPSTTMKPQTAFTFDVPDQFLIDELECKTSSSSFYSKLGGWRTAHFLIPCL